MTHSTETVWALMSRELDAFIKRRVGDDDVAADVLQETFVRIHNGVDGLQHEDRLVAWVYRIARNAIADSFRASKAAAERLRQLPGPAASADDGDATASTANLNATVGRWLIEMIATLPPAYRDAMELSEHQGLSQRDVADHLGLTPSGAGSRIQRGRRLLEQMLLDCCHVELDRYGNVVDYERRGACERCCGRSAGTE